jgi:hypothetical protein
MHPDALEDPVDELLYTPYPRLRLFGLTEMDQIPALQAGVPPRGQRPQPICRYWSTAWFKG